MSRVIERVRAMTPDITLVCDDGEVKAIKGLIMAASEPFRAMMLRFKDVCESTVSMEGADVLSVQAFVEYIQYDDLPTNIETLCNLSMLLDKWNVVQDIVLAELFKCAKNWENSVIITSLCVAECHEGLYVIAGASLLDYLDGCIEVCSKCDYRLATYSQWPNHTMARKCLRVDKNANLACDGVSAIIKNRVDLTDVDPEAVKRLVCNYFNRDKRIVFTNAPKPNYFRGSMVGDIGAVPILNQFDWRN